MRRTYSMMLAWHVFQGFLIAVLGASVAVGNALITEAGNPYPQGVIGEIGLLLAFLTLPGIISNDVRIIGGDGGWLGGNHRERILLRHCIYSNTGMLVHCV